MCRGITITEPLVSNDLKALSKEAGKLFHLGKVAALPAGDNPN